jgi:hypothetical protein
MAQKLAPVDPAIQQPIDQVILMLGATAPQEIDHAIVFGHFEVSQSVFVFNTLSLLSEARKPVKPLPPPGSMAMLPKPGPILTRGTAPLATRNFVHAGQRTNFRRLRAKGTD